MRLVRVSIEGYRSIKERLEVTLDPHVTVLLGANDHGKTNFLQALRHLNEAEGFETDDLNWDHADKAESLPVLRFELELAEDEQKYLVRLDSAARLASAANAAREDALSNWRDANDALQEDPDSSHGAKSRGRIGCGRRQAGRRGPRRGPGESRSPGGGSGRSGASQGGPG